MVESEPRGSESQGEQSRIRTVPVTVCLALPRRGKWTSIRLCWTTGGFGLRPARIPCVYAEILAGDPATGGGYGVLSEPTGFTLQKHLQQSISVGRCCTFFHSRVLLAPGAICGLTAIYSHHRWSDCVAHVAEAADDHEIEANRMDYAE